MVITLKKKLVKSSLNFFRKDLNHSTSYIQENDTRSVTDHGDSIRNNYNKYIYDTRRI